MKLHCKILLTAIFFVTIVSNAQEKSNELPILPNFTTTATDTIKAKLNSIRQTKGVKQIHWKLNTGTNIVDYFNENGQSTNDQGKLLQKVTMLNDSVKEVYVLDTKSHNAKRRPVDNDGYFLAHEITYNNNKQIIYYREIKNDLSELRIQYQYNPNSRLLTKIIEESIAILENENLNANGTVTVDYILMDTEPIQVKTTTIEYNFGWLKQITEVIYHQDEEFLLTKEFKVTYDNSFKIKRVDEAEQSITKKTKVKINDKKTKNYVFFYRENKLDNISMVYDYKEDGGLVTGGIDFKRNTKGILTSVTESKYIKTNKGVDYDEANAKRITTTFLYNNTNEITKITEQNKIEKPVITTITYTYF